MFKEFREFIARGNVIDLAVGIIIGSAFGGLVSSLVNDVVMPPVGLLLGGVDFSNLFINLSDKAYPSLKAAKDVGAPTLNYGLFMNNIINFLIISFVIFLLVRTVNQLKREPPPVTPTTRECPFCLSIIPLKASRCAHCTAEVRAS
jgi:large conductance mechanosensitive channel